jgi:DNA-binding NtrC family response regulator
MPTGTVLIVDDEIKIRSLLKRIISLEGYAAREASDLRSAIKIVNKEEVDVILCDVKLPDGSGIEFVQQVKMRFPGLAIILLTAYGNIRDGIQAMKNGAFDYLVKGDDNERVLPLLSRALENVRLQKKVYHLENQLRKFFDFDNIIGESTLIKEVMALAKRVSPTDVTVLLLGETGTGKELFARAIHGNSQRNGKPFIALNCSAFSKELLESELFGHKVGAFTGAVKDKAGLIEEANGGTLFLDEIGEMNIDLQAKLLRVLETGEFIKVGDVKSTRIDVRIVSATNKNLQVEVDDGKFREDLFYRLNVFSLLLPPLRERKKDIPLLARHFMKIFAERTGKHIEDMNKDFVSQLQLHSWEGNIRELKNILERAVILCETNTLTVENLPFDMLVNSFRLNNANSAFDLTSVEKLHIQRVLNYTKGNKAETARLLNIGLTTLYRKIEEYGLKQNTLSF